ncbi:hypothetical protein [Streptomyces sp. NPDC004728]
MRNRLAGYAFAALTLLAIYINTTGPALVCAAVTALTWKGHRTR